MVFMIIFTDWKERQFTRRRSCKDDGNLFAYRNPLFINAMLLSSCKYIRNLFVKRNPLFNNAMLMLFCKLDCVSKVCSGFEFDLTFSIISTTTRLNHSG